MTMPQALAVRLAYGGMIEIVQPYMGRRAEWGICWPMARALGRGAGDGSGADDGWCEVYRDCRAPKS